MTVTISPPTTTADPAHRAARPGAAHADRRCSLTVRAVSTAADFERWTAYAAAHPAATLFHAPPWARAVLDAFEHRPLHLLALRGARCIGVLPLMEVNSLLAGRLHVSVPYGTYGGILADDGDATGALAAEAVRRAQVRRARVLELRSDTAGVASFEPLPGYVGFTRRLPDDPAELPAFLPKRARAAARHARERDGVSIQHDPGQARLVWELYCRSMRRLASLNYPWRFFARLLELFGDAAWVSVAWRGGTPLAGTLGFVWGDTYLPYILGADERIPVDGAANLLYGAVMERAVRSGVRRFDYGRSRADNAGAVGFKKNQGFAPRPLGYQRNVPPGRRAPDLRPDSPRFAAVRRVWPCLPLAFTRPAGAFLARWIPG